MTIIDTHCHIDHCENISAALDRAEHAKVSDIIAVSVDLKACQTNLELSQKLNRPKIHLALGVHPGNIKVKELPETYNFIRNNINKAIAIGETGLDFWYKHVRKDDEKKREQKANFQWHLNLAVETGKPIIIHTRGTWKHCFEMAQATGIKKAHFHWFSGPVKYLKPILDAGYYVSTSPSVAYSPQSREAMAYAPLDRIMIETDTPVYYKNRGDLVGGAHERPLQRDYDESFNEGFQAEPKDVWKTLRALAELKGESEEKVLEIVNQNAKDFFNL